MSDTQIQLAVANFLDSAPASTLEGVSRRQQGTVVEKFLRCCYEGMGKAPRFLDGSDMHEVVGHLLPGRFARKDPLAEHAMDVLAAYVDHLCDVEVVTHAWEVKVALESTAAEFREAVRTGHAAHHGHAPPKPIVNRAPKTGRNDPCPCGSGKKFKKCCMELGES